MVAVGMEGGHGMMAAMLTGAAAADSSSSASPVVVIVGPSRSEDDERQIGMSLHRLPRHTPVIHIYVAALLGRADAHGPSPIAAVQLSSPI